MTDDYGNPQNTGIYPKVGDKFTMSYIDNAYFIDNRTGKKVTDDTPKKYMEYYIAKEHEVTYTVCALVKVPFSMGFRYGSVTGYNVVMSTDSLKNDSRQKISPLFYMLDSKNKKAEIRTENYLKNITSAPSSSLSFESKAKVRQEFDSFKNMVILLGAPVFIILSYIIPMLMYGNTEKQSVVDTLRHFV